MTSHAELSKQLALALGYCPESVRVKPNYGGGEHVLVYSKRGTHRKFPKWRVFDYRSPDVAMPLLVWLLDKHDMECYCELGLFVVRTSDVHHYVTADTLEEAIARAVIAVKGGK